MAFPSLPPGGCVSFSVSIEVSPKSCALVLAMSFRTHMDFFAVITSTGENPTAMISTRMVVCPPSPPPLVGMFPEGCLGCGLACGTVYCDAMAPLS